MTEQMQVTTPPVTKWGGLFKLGGIAAIIGGVLTVLDIMVYVVWPQPSTIES